MMLRPSLPGHLLGVSLLRCASLLVPARQRAEWWREWHAELWHVRQMCTPQYGVSWAAECEVASFCLGAFKDALCVREGFGARPISRVPIRGSATQCLRVLVGVAAISFGVAMLLPGASATLRFTPYRDTHRLMLIRDANRTGGSVPTISAEQYQLWKHRRQELFNEFAFYQPAQQTVGSPDRKTQQTRAVALASSNLFSLLGLSVRFVPETHRDLPRLILSEEMWKREFGGDRHIFGHTIQVGERTAVLGGVAPGGSWRLPGHFDAWLLLPEVQGSSTAQGFVLAHLQSSHAGWGEGWHMSAPTPAGNADDFFCESLSERNRGPGDVFLFAIILACLALPATTSLPLGEYRANSGKLSWFTWIRRWSFLGCKMALLLPIVYFTALDLAHLRTSVDPITSEYLQLVASFSICLFGLRWILRDQRQRCPVCLGKLTNPARVGQPSRSFLSWNGTELICVSGHGLLHVPEMPTSWFSEQRWLYLDSSWEVLFVEPGLASPGYF